MFPPKKEAFDQQPQHHASYHHPSVRSSSGPAAFLISGHNQQHAALSLSSSQVQQQQPKQIFGDFTLATVDTGCVTRVAIVFCDVLIPPLYFCNILPRHKMLQHSSSCVTSRRCVARNALLTCCFRDGGPFPVAAPTTPPTKARAPFSKLSILSPALNTFNISPCENRHLSHKHSHPQPLSDCCSSRCQSLAPPCSMATACAVLYFPYSRYHPFQQRPHLSQQPASAVVAWQRALVRDVVL
jgi:hypothetical protein